MESSEIEPRPPQPPEPDNNKLAWLVAGCLALTVCLTTLVVVAAISFLIANRHEPSGSELLAATSVTLPPPSAPRLTPAAQTQPALEPTPSAAPPGEIETAVAQMTLTPTTAPQLDVPSEINQEPPPESAFQSLTALLETDFPPRDYFESASRLGRDEVGKRKVSAQSYQIGDRRNFETDDGLRESVLMAITEHAYFWSESTLNYSQEQFAEAAQRLESDYFPSLIKLYGTDWQDGIDDDLRFSVLHLDGYADGSELGFFNSGDQYPRSVNGSSNEQEVIYLNMENLRPGEPLYFGTLVHELQHLVQWHSDPNEPVWLSEGLAQFTELYVGLDTVDTPPDYLERPGTRLNTWLHDAGDEIFAHYGASYLLLVYFWEQLGDTAIQRLMQQPADGLAGIGAVLDELNPGLTLDQFVLDWATANYLDDAAYGPRYEYQRLALETPEHTHEVYQAPFETLHSQEQFGVSYVRLDLQGQNSLRFAGDATAELLPVAPRSGEMMWFVPALNELDAQLTASFDLTGLTSANLNYWAWYDLEEDYDFAYVSISRDGGLTWDLLMPEHAGAGEFGPALSGRSDEEDDNVAGWVEETVSLSAYAGSQVLIRFELLSDSAIAETGFAIDDIAISELGYLNDVETDDGRWQAKGFVRTGHLLPQIWRLNLIVPGSAPQIVSLDLNDRDQGQWTVDLGQEGGILVITSQTPFVNEPADYWLAIGR